MMTLRLKSSITLVSFVIIVRHMATKNKNVGVTLNSSIKKLKGERKKKLLLQLDNIMLSLVNTGDQSPFDDKFKNLTTRLSSNMDI